jgi:predicted nucleic acid-binding protein
MTRYLVDTDGIIDYLNGFAPTVTLLRELYERGDELCTCDVVLAEVYAGLHPHEIARAERLLTTLTFLSTSADAARQAGIWRYQFARQGRQFATTDCIIAAVAGDHGAIVLTRNTDDYPMAEVNVVALPRPPR